MRYKIILQGCDDYTEIEMELMSDEYELLKTVQNKTKEKSTYQCQPTLEIEEIKVLSNLKITKKCMKKVIKMYLHGDKDDNYSTAEELGLSKEATSKFSYALYEVECEVEVDLETGETRLLSAKEVLAHYNYIEEYWCALGAL